MKCVNLFPPALRKSGAVVLSWIVVSSLLSACAAEKFSYDPVRWSAWGRFHARAEKYSAFVRWTPPPNMEPVQVSFYDFALTPLFVAGCRVRCRGNVALPSGDNPYRVGTMRPLESLPFIEMLDRRQQIVIGFQKGELPEAGAKDVSVVGVADGTSCFEFFGWGPYGFPDYMDHLSINGGYVDCATEPMTNATVRSATFYASPIPEFKVRLTDSGRQAPWIAHYYSGYLKVAQLTRKNDDGEDMYKFQKFGIWVKQSRNPLFELLRRLNEALPKDVVCGNVSDDGFVRAYPFSAIKCHVISKERQQTVYEAVEMVLKGVWDIPANNSGPYFYHLSTENLSPVDFVVEKTL